MMRFALTAVVLLFAGQVIGHLSGQFDLRITGDATGLDPSHDQQVCRPGKSGAKGAQGIKGEEGEKGVRGLQGAQGVPGVKGEKGGPAEPCDCSGMERLEEKVEGLQELLSHAFFMRTCDDVKILNPTSPSGVHSIYHHGNWIPVYCDLTTDGGGWTVIQKRVDGHISFHRMWQEYVEGFGDKTSEYWLGLETIHQLTKDGEYSLRVDMEDFDGNTKYAHYSEFIVGSSATDYTLTIGGYSGTAGDSMAVRPGSSRWTNGQPFSAPDHDSTSVRCATQYRSGWWFNLCHWSSLNGLYLHGEEGNNAKGVNWFSFKSRHYSLKRAEMKIRKRR